RLTTAEARALGITRVLSSFSTPYAGTADRVRNLQLAVSLLDGAIVRPGRVFSLNARVGERTLERGFRPAPVIIGGEYKEGVGGGVSQVATTVFNAAWEAGLKIVERNPHSLYISRYPLGRDATVNYPDLDLKFLNDTGRPLLVRGASTASGITISIYGAPTGRRVVSEPGALVVTGPAPLRTIRDPSLNVGTTVIEEEGSPSTAVTVKRTVIGARGRVLYRETWRTAYRGELRVVRVGTRPLPKPEPKPRTETETERPEKGTTVEAPQREKPKPGTVTTPPP
ncbi:MAG: VanW family protein, partial [Actinomycetota bacterium]|nr:VanW family protein [Actinomycetota bacterium]